MMNIPAYFQILARMLRRKPTFLSFNVSNCCNERCPMCNVWRTPSEELGISELERIFAGMKRLGIKVVEISGGEPFLRDDLPQLIGLLDRLGFQFTMTTNGTLWRDEVVEALRGARGLLQLAVSLDSLQPEVYARLRGVDTLPAVLANIDSFRAAGIAAPMKINLTLSRHNVGEVSDLLTYCRSRGLYLSVFPANVGARRVHSAEAPTLAADQAERQRMAEVFEGLARLRRKGEPLWEFSRFYMLAADYLLGNQMSHCDAGELYLDLHADGMLASCVEREGVADLRREAVEEAWQRITAERQAVRSCSSTTPCCYTCTMNVAETARHPLQFALETMRVRWRMRTHAP